MEFGNSMSYFTRSQAAIRPGYQPPGYQAPVTRPSHPPAPFQQPVVSQPSAASSPFSVDRKIDADTVTVDGLLPVIDALKPQSEFELGVTNVLRLLVGHLKEIKLDQFKQTQTTENTFCQVDQGMVGLTKAVVKGEQYNRRDTITMVGLPKAADETEATLTTKVAQHLSATGETVTSQDFTAVHRNGKDDREVRGKKVPPSITVKFHSISKKDSILKNYKNYDEAAKQPRKVKLYQSLSPHYAQLRRSIIKFFDTANVGENFGKELQWVTYQSPTAGLAVKLKSKEYFRDVHVVDDFVLQFRSLVKPRG